MWLSSGKVFQGNGQFQSDFQWLPKIGDRLLKAVVYVFLNEVEIGMWHPDKILVSWYVGVYEVGQAVAVASCILSLKDPGHDPGVWWLSSSGGWLGLGLRLCWWLYGR